MLWYSSAIAIKDTCNSEPGHHFGMLGNDSLSMQHQAFTMKPMKPNGHHDANFVVIGCTPSAANDNKVGIMMTFGFHFIFSTVILIYH